MKKGRKLWPPINISSKKFCENSIEPNLAFCNRINPWLHLFFEDWAILHIQRGHFFLGGQASWSFTVDVGHRPSAVHQQGEQNSLNSEMVRERYSRIRLYHPRIYHPAVYIDHFRPEPNFYISKPSGYITHTCLQTRVIVFPSCKMAPMKRTSLTWQEKVAIPDEARALETRQKSTQCSRATRHHRIWLFCTLRSAFRGWIGHHRFSSSSRLHQPLWSENRNQQLTLSIDIVDPFLVSSQMKSQLQLNDFAGSSHLFISSVQRKPVYRAMIRGSISKRVIDSFQEENQRLGL